MPFTRTGIRSRTSARPAANAPARGLSLMLFRSSIGSVMRAYGVLLVLALSLCLTACGSHSVTGDAANARYAGNAPDIPPSPKSSAVVRTAKAATGTPYHWGGCTPAQGFDCSGLVWWAFHENGLSIPRTTDEQISAGLDADCSRLRQGDVLVFEISSKGLHSGIYSGNGRFIHSPKTGHVVREEALRKEYWLSRLLTCRRVAP